MTSIESPSSVWIVGQGGLLGSHLRKAVRSTLPHATLWQPEHRFAWDDQQRVEAELKAAVTAFSREAQKAGHWMLLWAAGTGIVGAKKDILRRETALLGLMLAELSDLAKRVPGLLFHASTAGALYGHCPDHILTEQSIPDPISDYGKEKLLQERCVQEWSDAHPLCRVLIGRIANLYGPGQNLQKPQGLISHISRCMILRKTLHIYVPLDTVRDYVYAQDCATSVVQALGHYATLDDAPSCIMKIFASQQAVSIAHIIGLFTALSRRKPELVLSHDSRSAEHRRIMQFSSTVWPEICPSRTLLPVGLFRVHQHQLLQFAAGELSLQ